MFGQVYESVSHDLLPPYRPDIDECSQSIGHLCTYKCVNVPGSYQCACPEYGYTMSPNGRSCRGEPPPHPAKKNKTNKMHTLTASLQMQEFCSEVDLVDKNAFAPIYFLQRAYSNGYTQINIIGTFTVAQ